MEALVTIVAVGAYAERQYQKQDGSSEYFKSRGVTMKRGGDVFYGEIRPSNTLIRMFTYQKDTKSLFVAECGKKDFWREIRKSSTAFNIDTRREILRAVDAKDEEAMQKWAEHTDFQKFMLKTLRDLKTKAGKERNL